MSQLITADYANERRNYEAESRKQTPNVKRRTLNIEGRERRIP
jgi:hypothetical protein